MNFVRNISCQIVQEQQKCYTQNLPIFKIEGAAQYLSSTIPEFFNWDNFCMEHCMLCRQLQQKS